MYFFEWFKRPSGQMSNDESNEYVFFFFFNVEMLYKSHV